MKNIVISLVSLGWAVALVQPGFGAKAWLQDSRKSPEWFTKGVMYQIQPRAFTAEGTLKAAEKKLPYLRDLGVTIAYLVPVMKMDASRDKAFWSPRQVKSGFDNPKNQYRISDYFHVDEEYGSDEDLRDFCVAAHGLGMKVVFDLVYLHCGPTAPFLREHPEFTWWNADGSVKQGPWRFPKLNFAEPGVRKYLDGNVRYLLTNYGADGFRCDVGDGIPLDFWCVFSRPLADGSIAAGLYNKGLRECVIPLEMEKLGILCKWRVRDVWSQQDEGVFLGKYEMSVPGHATHLVRLYPLPCGHLREGMADIRDNAWELLMAKDRKAAAR